MREMKDSGIEWVKAIPKSWNNETIRHLMIERDGGAWGNEPSDDYSGTICLRIADFDFNKGRFKKNDIEDLTRREYPAIQVKRLSLKARDILIEKSGGGEKTPVGRAVYYAGEYGSVMYANFMERLRFDSSRIDSEFVEYWLRAWYACRCSPYYINQTTGIQNINLTLMLAKERIFFPALYLQKAIVNFLDTKCAEIDALTADIESQIDTLEQYKKSVITETITKGLNPDAEMKDSGIEWIGEIPKEWETNRIKYLFTSSKGLPITKENLIDDGLPVISYGQIHSKDNNGTTVKSSLLRYVNDKYQVNNNDCEVHKYDFVFADTSEDYDGCGNCVYKRDEKRLFGGYHTIILHSSCKKDNRFFAYLFKTDLWRKQIRELVSGVKVFSITQRIIMNTTVIVPTLIEQESISNFLDTKCAEIDSIITDKKAQLSTLEDYKKSLIFEYVTGKKEVPIA